MMRTYQIRWLLLVALLCASAGTAAALDIVYPSDKTFFPHSNFLIIKGGEKPVLDGVSVEINGVASDVIDISTPEYRSAFSDFLILQPEFAVGKNQITVRGYAGGKEAAKAAADVFYLDGDPTATPPAGYAPFVMHLPEKERLCLPCHNMNPDKVQLGSDNVAANPCASCHKTLVAKNYVHGPAGVWGCTTCHDERSQPARWKVRQEGGGLCTECHSDKIDEFQKSGFVHGPVGVGMCTLCHDPHASNQPAQLLSDVNTLCNGCHVTIKEGDHVVRGVSGKGHPLKGKPDPLRAERKMSCVSCHNPHGGESRSLFIRKTKGRFELCMFCHKK